MPVHDCWGTDFALLAGIEGGAWHEAAASTGIDLRCIGTAENAELFQSAYGVDADGAVLVRPDGFIAWRSRGAATDAQAVLRRVLTDLSLKGQEARADRSAAEAEAADAG